MKFIGGGWVGGGGVGIEGGWEAEGGQYTIHSEANSSIGCSVEHRNCHSQPGRCRRSLAAVWHTM